MKNEYTNQDVLNDLFKENYNELLDFARYRLDKSISRRVDPEDIIQDVYLKLSKALVSENNKLTLETFFDSFHNLIRSRIRESCIESYREHNLAKRRSVNSEISAYVNLEDNEENDVVNLLTKSESDPIDKMIKDENLDSIIEQIASMESADHQDILNEYFFNHKTISQYAEENNLKYSVAAMRLDRAVRSLKKNIMKEKT